MKRREYHVHQGPMQQTSSSLQLLSLADNIFIYHWLHELRWSCKQWFLWTMISSFKDYFWQFSLNIYTSHSHDRILIGITGSLGLLLLLLLLQFHDSVSRALMSFNVVHTCNFMYCSQLWFSFWLTVSLVVLWLIFNIYYYYYYYY